MSLRSPRWDGGTLPLEEEEEEGEWGAGAALPSSYTPGGRGTHLPISAVPSPPPKNARRRAAASPSARAPPAPAPSPPPSSSSAVSRSASSPSLAGAAASGRTAPAAASATKKNNRRENPAAGAGVVVVFSSGYDVSMCVTAPKETLLCTLCHGLMRDAVGSQVCPHLFCAGCISSHIAASRSSTSSVAGSSQRGGVGLCPVDRRPIRAEHLYDRVDVRKQVDATLVACIRRDCGAHVFVGNLAKHLGHECRSRVVSCEVCDKRVLAHQLPQHKEESQAEHVRSLLQRNKALEAERARQERREERLTARLRQQEAQVDEERETVRRLQGMLSDLQRWYQEQVEENRVLRGGAAPAAEEKGAEEEDEEAAVAAMAAEERGAATPARQGTTSREATTPGASASWRSSPLPKRHLRPDAAAQQRPRPRERGTAAPAAPAGAAPSGETSSWAAAATTASLSSSGSLPSLLADAPASFESGGAAGPAGPAGDGGDTPSPRTPPPRGSRLPFLWDQMRRHRLAEVGEGGALIANRVGLAAKSAAGDTAWDSGVHEWAVNLHACRAACVGVVPADVSRWNAGGTLGLNLPGWAIRTADGELFSTFERPPKRGAPWGGRPLQLGDTLGVRLDMGRGTLEFYRNGVPMGVAFTQVHGRVRPAVSLCYQGDSLRLVPVAGHR